MNRTIILTLSFVWSILCTFAQNGIEIPAKLSDRPELIIKHTGYTMSYNTTHSTPNWSAWVLTKSHVQQSTVERTNQFLPDPLVPIAYRVQPSDYTNSGYDRGHLCPAADMAWSTQAMHDCFYMSNMCPQVPALNRVSWKALETKCRQWAQTEDTLYIVCGPVYSKVHKVLVSSSNPPYTINHTLGSAAFTKSSARLKEPSIDVPSGFFKVVLSLHKGHPKAIGFYYTNTSSKQSMTSTAKTVDEIEKLTGIDFFYTLPDSIENAIESQYNLNDWR